MANQKYKLYALPFSTEAFAMARSARFSRICADYLLIYASKKLENAVEIKGDDLNQLNGAESRWLFDCNMALLAEDASNRSGDILRDMRQKLDAIAAALEQERKKGSNGESGEKQLT